MTTPSLPSLERLLDAARMRIMASRAAPRALGTIAVLSLAAACAVPPMRWLGLGHPWWVVVLPAIGGVMALSAAWRARPDRRRAATAVDTSHGFHDALATALSAEHSRHADPVFVELQRRSLESLLPRADLRRLDSPLPRPIALAGCAAALALLGAVLLIDWPLPRPSVRGADATVAETDAANAALADAQAAESEARELAELAQRIQLLADEGRLGDAERAFEELEAKSRALSRRLRSTEAEGADSPEADATRTALLESASRIGDASQSIGERTRPQEGDRDARASAEPRDQLDAPARVEAERTLPPAPGTTDSVHQPAPRERETMPPLPESSGTNDTVSRPTESSRSNETKARERESLPREGGTEKSDSRDARTSDATAREGATGDTATRDSATRDAAARDSATRDSATRDSATRDAAARDSATGDRRAQDPLAPGSQSRPSPGTKPPSQQPPGTESRSDQAPGAKPASQQTPGAEPPSPAMTPGEQQPSQQPAVQRELLRQRLEDLSRRLGTDALGGEQQPHDRHDPQPRRPESLGDEQIGRPGTDRDATRRTRGLGESPEGRESGRGAGAQRGSEATRADEPATTARESYDIEAVRPDPDYPGRVLERQREHDPSAPTSAHAGPADSSAARADRRGAADDPAVAPRFRPLVARYFERVKSSRSGSGSGESAPAKSPEAPGASQPAPSP